MHVREDWTTRSSHFRRAMICMYQIYKVDAHNSEALTYRNHKFNAMIKRW